MPSVVSSLIVLAPVVLLACAQVLLRWQARALGDERLDALAYLKALGSSAWLWGALVLAGVALIFWLLALRRYPLSYAYPFISLSFPLVALLSVLALGERLSLGQSVGLGLIVVGVALNARYGG